LHGPTSPSEKIAFVQRLPLLPDLSRAACGTIISAAHEKRLLPRQTIFSEGDSVQQVTMCCYWPCEDHRARPEWPRGSDSVGLVRSLATSSRSQAANIVRQQSPLNPLSHSYGKWQPSKGSGMGSRHSGGIRFVRLKNERMSWSSVFANSQPKMSDHGCTVI
jgi:hypothetical protein